MKLVSPCAARRPRGIVSSYTGCPSTAACGRSAARARNFGMSAVSCCPSASICSACENPSSCAARRPVFTAAPLPPLRSRRITRATPLPAMLVQRATALVVAAVVDDQDVVEVAPDVGHDARDGQRVVERRDDGAGARGGASSAAARSQGIRTCPSWRPRRRGGARTRPCSGGVRTSSSSSASPGPIGLRNFRPVTRRRWRCSGQQARTSRMTISFS